MALSINYGPLEQAQKRLDVLGKNIANVNSSGYKKFIFSDDKSASAIQDFSQGTISTSTNPLDLAITGDSLFRMENAGKVTYSRNGQFTLSKEGYVVDSFGNYLTGYGLNDKGVVDETNLVSLKINKSESKPKATVNAVLSSTLDSTSAVITSTSQMSPQTEKASPVPGSYNFSTFITTFDSIGNSHTVQSYFVKKTEINTWDMYLSYDGASIDANKNCSGPIVLSFDKSNGSLTKIDDKSASDSKIKVVGKSISFGGISIDLSGCQERGSPFSSNVSQNGLSSAPLTGYSVDQNGFINGMYSNGSTAKLGQLVLAKFNNLQGLKQEANNQWSESPESGAAQVGKPGDSKFGIIQGSALESSNVDLTVEMVKLISAQRAFQSAAEVLKKQDEIMQNINNISR